MAVFFWKTVTEILANPASNVALSLAGRILEISQQNSQDADSLCTPIFSANRGIFGERWGYFLRISAFREDLMGKQIDLAPRFRAKYALFARG